MVVMLFIVSGVTVAQSSSSTQRDPSPPTNALKSETAPATADIMPATTVDDRLKAMENDLRQQSRILVEMRAIIAEQQRVIETLSARAANGDQKISGQSGAASAQASSTPQTPTLEDRVKKVEGRMLAIGGLRFSGDFRLRFDGIFRKADPNPPAGFTALTHQQNARMRYRLRLNIDTDINAKLSVHGQLATGPINNPLTMDQDFGETTARHPFFISEAWVDFHPNKSVQLQGGRVQEIFADNSRFLFDDDIRFNGFNEKYTFAFNVQGLAPAGTDSGTPIAQHQAEVFLPLDYPRRPPFCRMITPVFHPNIDPQKICIGDHWSAGQSLAQMVVHIGEMICYQRYNLKSPLNAKAAVWAEQNLSGLPLQSGDLSAGL